MGQITYVPGSIPENYHETEYTTLVNLSAGTATDIVHNLNDEGVVAQIFNEDGTVFPSAVWRVVDANTISVQVATAGNYRVSVVGGKVPAIDVVPGTTTPKILYGVDEFGVQHHFPYDVEAIPDTIPMRAGTGTVRGEDPIEETDLVNKRYFDLLMAKKANLYEIQAGLNVTQWGTADMGGQVIVFQDTDHTRVDDSAKLEDIVFDNGYILQWSIVEQKLALYKNGANIVTFFDGATQQWSNTTYTLPADVGAVQNYDAFESTSTQRHFLSLIADLTTKLIDVEDCWNNCMYMKNTFLKIETYPTKADFPVIGDEHTIYRDNDTDWLWMWEGDKYELTMGGVEEAPDDEGIYVRHRKARWEITARLLVDGGLVPAIQVFNMDGGIVPNVQTEKVDGGTPAIII